MSKYNNVNPDHYKVAGRERPGKGIVNEPRRARTTTPAQERFRKRQRESVGEKQKRGV